ncbi:glyoxylate/hydroxypyruvate reductase A [Acuticoccus sp. MNP-M23]|uniref:2-hydroxyacid dehydrogenase n=1 Tax=Acuticoccus sp. MNP-M23 TaxID=3072793 RepID=UPI002814EDB5|nr:glyoxylate/hydroxypyruvate reductase A [Acuticoccus sp. MNP-M23]WMS43501.1 glyoxylate/hydroxypyruvate reductase A [Acuticoccus sp. MNP-M23]
MTLVIRVGPARQTWWLEHMTTLLPELDVRLWDDPGPLEAVKYAVVWKPPAGGLKQFPNLEVIHSIGAGIDHILEDPELPAGVPIIRATGDDLTQRMREYVALHVLRFHRNLPALEEAMPLREWRQSVNPPAYERKVGIMGLGNLGADCAKALSVLGFDVAGWSRSEKTIDGVTTFHAPEGLDAFLARTEILVCLLPLTEETRGILNTSLFDRLPKGASIINAARGQHLVDDDLLDALARNQIDGATLDVFHTEPLPAKHPFWEHPKVLVTPHVASLIDPDAGGKRIAANLRRFIAGEDVPDMVDLSRGY